MVKQKDKKIIFVIVEGPSDQEALTLALKAIFSSEEVYVHVTFGDITTKYGTRPDNIVKIIDAMVRKYRQTYRVKLSDFMGIIHIVDTDGAFISPDFVVEDSTAQRVIYTLEEIRTKNKKEIEVRNIQKRNNIGKLTTVKQINSISYRIFYMSSNLDHVLYDKQMSTDGEKETNAHLFAKKYKNNPEGFLDFVNNSDFSVSGPYKQTWDFIKKDKNSLHRHTNLGICLSSKKIGDLL